MGKEDFWEEKPKQDKKEGPVKSLKNKDEILDNPDLKNFVEEKKTSLLLQKDKEELGKLQIEKEKHQEEIKKAEEKMAAIQRSTKTLIPQFLKLHNYCRMRMSWYYKWSAKSYSSLIHWIVLILWIIFVIFASILSVKASIDFAPGVAEKNIDYSKIYSSVPEGSTEIVAKRTETQKVFKRPDGKEQYIISSGPLHYKDASNAWKNIDSSIVAKEDGSGFTMDRSIYSADFNKQFTADPLVQISKDDQALSMKPGELFLSNVTEDQKISSPINSEGAGNGHQIIYKNAYGPGLDFAYETQDLQLNKKLNIASLESLPTPTIDMTSETNANLKLQLQFGINSGLDLFIDNQSWDGTQTMIENKSLIFKKDGKTLWQLTPPQAWDSSVPATSDSSSVITSEARQSIITGKATISKTGDKLNMSVLFPYSWLKTAQYPVTIDPEYTGIDTDGFITGDDGGTTDYSLARSTSSYYDTGANYLEVGQMNGFDPVEFIVSRGYVEFDTSGIADSDNVTQANLYMTASGDITYGSDFTVQIHKFDWGSPISAGNQESNYDGALTSDFDANWRSTSGMSLNTPYGSSVLDNNWVKKASGEKTRYVLLSNKDVAGISNNPTNEDGVDHQESIYIHSQTATTEAYRPYLSITAAPAGPNACQSATTGNWSDAGSWTACGGTTPQAGDSVTILNTHTITMTADASVTTGSITINSGGALATGDFNLITTNITIAGTLTADGNTITVAGSWDSSGGTFTANTSSVQVHGTALIARADATTSFYDLTTAYTGVITTTTNAFTVSHLLTVASGSLKGTWNRIVLTGTGDVIDMQSGATMIGSGSNLYIAFRGNAATNIPASANYCYLDFNSVGNATYTLTGDITSKQIVILPYVGGTTTTLDMNGHNITQTANTFTIGTTDPRYGKLMNSSGTTSQLTVAGPLVINYYNYSTMHNILDATNINISAADNWTNNDTFTAGASTVTFTKAIGTQTLNSGGTSATTQAFNNLTHTASGAGTGTLQLLTNDINIDGNFTNSAGTFDTNGKDMTVAGSWTNSGTFTPGTRTVTFDGTATGKTINPGASSFYNLTHNGSGGAWTALINNVTVGNNLTITAGTFDPAALNLTVTGAFSNSANFGISGTRPSGIHVFSSTWTNTTGATFWLSNNAATTTIYNNVVCSGTLDATSNGGLIIGGSATTVDFTSGTYTKGTGTLLFTRSGNTTITFTPSASDFGAVAVRGVGNGSRQTVTVAANLTLSSLAIGMFSGSPVFFSYYGIVDITNRTMTITGSGTPLSFGASSTGTLTAGAGSTVIYTGTGATNVATVKYNNLELYGATTYSQLGALTSTNAITGTLTIDANAIFNPKTYGLTVTGAFVNNGSFGITGTRPSGAHTFSSTWTSSGTAYYATSNTTSITGLMSLTGGTFTMATSNGTITLAGGMAINNGAVWTKGSGTITFANTQNISDANTTPNDLGTVATSGTATITMTNNITLTSLNIANSTTFNASSTLTINGTGTPLTTNTSGIFTAGNGTVIYTGTTTATNITAVVYNNLTLTPTGTTTYSLAGHLDAASSKALTGNLTINTDATLDTTASNYNITLAGNWTNSGTFTANSGTVTMTGASVTIGGGNGTYFNNLTINTAGTVTVNIDNNYFNNLDVTGTLVIAATRTFGPSPNGNNASPTVNVRNSSTINGTGTFRVVNGNISITLTGTGAFAPANTNFEIFTILDVYALTVPAIAYGGNLNLITMGEYSTGTHTIASGNLSVNGDITFCSMAYSGSETNKVVNSNNTPISLTGNWRAGSAGFSINNSINTYTKGTENITFNGTGAQTIDGNMGNFNDVTIANTSAAISLAAHTTLSGTLTINSGATLSTSASNYNLTVGGNWTNSGGTFTPGISTVTFNGTATGHTINPGASSFYNLTFNGSGGAWSPLTNTVTITNNLTMTAGTFDNSNGTANVSVSGNTTGTAGIINMTANTFRQNGTKNIGTTSGSTDWTFNNLNFETTGTVTTSAGGTGKITVGDTLTVGGLSPWDITTFDNETNDRILEINNINILYESMIMSPDIFSASSSAAFTVSGNWTNNGTFTPGTGTVTLDGTNSSTISGSTTFNNLTMNTTGIGAKTITFPTGSGNKQIVNGTWTLDGDTGKVLTLNSATPATPWYFQTVAPFTAGDYINVTDSYSANTNKITPGANTTNGGNNDGWIFNQAPTNDSLTFTNPYSNNIAISDDTTEWQFQAKVSDVDGPTDIDYVEIRFANVADSTTPYGSLKYRWTQSTDTFSEVTDTQSAGTITSTAGDATSAVNQWTVNFKIKLNNNFLDKDTNYAAELYTVDNAAASDLDNYANIYQVTTLSISLDVDSATIAFGGLLPGSILTATTISTVTTNYPNGYNLAISDNIAGTDSALLHTDAATRIADYIAPILLPTLWSGTGLGICVYSATGKNAKWGTGTTETDAQDKYASVPETTTTIHSKTGSPTSSDVTKTGYKVVVPNNQKTGDYSGNVTYTATGVLL